MTSNFNPFHSTWPEKVQNYSNKESFCIFINYQQLLTERTLQNLDWFESPLYMPQSSSFLFWISNIWLVCGSETLVDTIVVCTTYKMNPHVLGGHHLTWQGTGTAPGNLQRWSYPGSMGNFETVVSIFCLKLVQSKADLSVGNKDQPDTAEVWRVTIWKTRRAYLSSLTGQDSSTAWKKNFIYVTARR